MKELKKAIAITALTLVALPAAGADGGKRSEHFEKRFQEADTNDNGIITHDEMMAGVKRKFGEFDKNSDGFLALAELPKEMPVPERAQKRMEKRMERMKERAEANGHEFDPDGVPGKGRYGKPTRIKFIAKHDKDGDELVSLEEFSRKAVRHFKHADLNGDGEVTKSEAKKAMKKRFKKKRGDQHFQPHKKR